jgi:hypothetical protein
MVYHNKRYFRVSFVKSDLKWKKKLYAKREDVKIRLIGL